MKGKREFPPNVVGDGDVLSHLSKFLQQYRCLKNSVNPNDLIMFYQEWYFIIRFCFSASSCDVQYEDSSIHLTMVPNPSHLEVCLENF